MKVLNILFALIIFSQTQAQNYDEAKVPAYTLPAVLTTSSNTPVTKKSQWEKVRRPEILTLFENNVYGQMPKTYDDIKFTVTHEDASAMDGKAHLKEVQIAVSKNNKAVRIDLVLFVPNKRSKPAPAFLLTDVTQKYAQ